MSNGTFGERTVITQIRDSLLSDFKLTRSINPRLIFVGSVAKWPCSGLQSRPRWFDSGPSLHSLQRAEHALVITRFEPCKSATH